MKNKLISLFILIAFFWTIFYFFYYFFILHKWNLTISSNVSNYQVELYNEKLNTNFASDCKSKKCELIDLAPFSYKITIKKEWYKDIISNIEVLKNTTINLDINLEKQLQIKQVSNNQDNTNKTQKQSEQLNKFRDIAFLQKTYKYFDLQDLWYFYFIKNKDNSLTLFNKKNNIDVKIYSFNNIIEGDLDIQKISMISNQIIILYWDDKYIYDIESWKITKIFFPQNINYVKKDWENYYFVNDKWTFVYNINNLKIEYFYIFKDFINYDTNNYLWVIYKDETDKIKNYNLSWYEGENLIIKYNFQTKNLKVLQSTLQDISKITKEDGNIYFYDNSWNKYLVNNVE